MNPIDGEEVGSGGVENINPSNPSEVLGVYARATAEETQQAVAAAKAAFPAWSRSDILERHCGSFQVRPGNPGPQGGTG